MATRTSTVWKPAGVIMTIDDATPIEKKTYADYLMNMKPENVTYEFIMESFGEFNGQQVAHAYDILQVPKGGWSYQDKDGKTYNNSEAFQTTIGIYVFNLIMEEFHFCRFFNGYHNQNLNKKGFKNIDQTLTYALKEDEIDVETFKRWNDTIQWLMPFEDILSPNHTEKMITCTKILNKKKAELIKANQKAIDEGDIVVAEKIEKELLDFAKEYLGDDPSMDTILSGAGGVYENNFKNMYVMKGAVANHDPSAKQKYNIVTSNYMDGVKADEYAIIAGSGVAGAYSRAKKTETGGYWEKLFIRAYQHIKLDPKGTDCKSPNYVTVELTDKNFNDWIYSYVIKNDGNYERLDTKTKSKYIGKKVKVRFSSMCKSKTGICNICAGDLLYDVAENIGLCMAQIPDILKNRNMKAFHDSTVQTSTMNVMKVFYPFND